MRILSTSLVAISVIGPALAVFTLDSDVPRVCGTYAGTTEEIAAAEAHFQNLIKHVDNFTLAKRDPVEIQVNWNVFYDKNNPSDGNYTDNVIDDSLDYVNLAMSLNGFNLLLVKNRTRRNGIEYNDLHGVAQYNYLERFIKLVRIGDESTLNVYTVGENPNNKDVAWATFPVNYTLEPWRDGIVLTYDYLPGVNDRFPERNHGALLVHELGHWLGLYHTFQDGCNGNGDYVSDTPAEADNKPPTFQCIEDNTCLTCDGDDPIHNYMDYSSDDCYTEFTPGQLDRVTLQILAYRGIRI